MCDLEKRAEYFARMMCDLVKRAEYFASSALSDSTKKAYESDWKGFHLFCLENKLEPLPANPETICLFIANLADLGISVATITRRLTAITAIHEATGHLSPSKSSQVGIVLKGIKRKCGRPIDSSQAILWNDLKKMVGNCDSLMFGLRDRAILLLGWASALRRSELVGLNVGDLEFREEGLIINLGRSKTDQEGKGRTIGIPKAENDICPVKSVREWLERRNEKGVAANEPLFPALGIHCKGRFWYTTGKRLTPRMISLIVKRYARYAGLHTDKLSAHSLRRGLATQAGQIGVPERIIARHTGHRSVAVLRTYIESGTIWQDNPLTAIYVSFNPIAGINQDV